MKIQDKDYYHGAALTQIIEHPQFTALNKVNKKYGHYLINHDIRLLVKLCTAMDSPWSYTFWPDDLTTIQQDISAGAKTFICLICGLDTICILNAEQIQMLIDLDAAGSQWIRVEVHTKKGSLWVQGQRGEYHRAIPHNAFPDALFV